MFVEEWMTVAANQRCCLQVWVLAEALTEIAAEVDLVVALALTLIVVAAIRKEGSIHSLTGVFLFPYND
jgi:hypothetical protein